MAVDERVNLYLVLSRERLLDAMGPMRPLHLYDLTVDLVDQAFRALLGPNSIDYTPRSVPFVQPYRVLDVLSDVPDPNAIIFSISLSTEPNNLQAFTYTVENLITGGTFVTAVDIDPTVSVGDLHVPVPSDGALFGTRSDALTLIGANPGLGISDPGPVNVVVIDSGFDLGCVPAGQFGGGWQPLPGGLDLPTPMPPGMTRGPEGLHGAMIVENVLALAPKAMIFDVPLIPPPKIYDVPTFLHLAEAIYQALLVQIPFYSSYFPGPWVLVNAWSVYDRRSELPKLGQYTENKGYFGPPHAFIKLIQQIAGAHYDMVFAAGNCGEYCPDGRCGPDDYGPGRSIWGANAHAGVITPGAVRVDATWLGFSSEGPGPTPHLAAAKPDLCAPTQFLGPSGLYPFSTGTSASAAVTAGVVAALRTKWDQTKVPPVILKLVLNYSATQPLGIGWNPWFGNGILNAAAAFNTLHAAYP